MRNFAKTLKTALLTIPAKYISILYVLYFYAQDQLSFSTAVHFRDHLTGTIKGSFNSLVKAGAWKSFLTQNHK